MIQVHKALLFGALFSTLLVCVFAFFVGLHAEKRILTACGITKHKLDISLNEKLLSVLAKMY